MEPRSVEKEIGGRVLKIETGSIARQAGGSALVTYVDTVVLVAASQGGIREGEDFFPLTVEYQEKTYAAGKFPGGFYKREGRPTTKEILADPCTSSWLKNAIGDSSRRDIVDAMNDAEFLAKYLKNKFEAMSNG